MHMSKFLLLLLLLVQLLAWKSVRHIKFINRCRQTLWVGAFAIPQPVTTGWEMKPGAEFNLAMPANTVAGRFWARTDCTWNNGKFHCLTGDCGTPNNNFGIECKGITGQAPATLAEITMNNNGGSDFYDISNVDGYNVPIYFGPIPGTFQRVNNPDLGRFNCGSPGCTLDTSKCPRELKIYGESATYCYSICAAVYDPGQVDRNRDILGPIAGDAMKKDLVCCACGVGNDGCTDPRSHYCCSPLDPRTNIGGRCYVQNWPKPSQNFDRYDRVFKNQCPDAYSWQFDDNQSTYQCVDGDYEMIFCPNQTEEVEQ